MIRKTMLSLAVVGMLSSDAFAQRGGRPSGGGGGGGGMRPSGGFGGGGGGGGMMRPAGGFSGGSGGMRMPVGGGGGGMIRPPTGGGGMSGMVRPGGGPSVVSRPVNNNLISRPNTTTFPNHVSRPPVTTGTVARPPIGTTRPPNGTTGPSNGTGMNRPNGIVGNRPNGNGSNYPNGIVGNRPNGNGSNRPNGVGRPNGLGGGAGSKFVPATQRAPRNGVTIVFSSTKGNPNYCNTNGRRASFGCYYQGFDHRHWQCRQWSGRHNCWFFFDNGCNSWYYWCQQDGCYYPSSHIPYQSYCVVTPIVEEPIDNGVESTGEVQTASVDPIEPQPPVGEVPTELPPLPGEEQG